MVGRRFPNVGGGGGAGWSADSGGGERPDGVSRQWAAVGEEFGSQLLTPIPFRILAKLPRPESPA